MTTEYDPQGRQKLATDWLAISNIPGLVLSLGEAALPGSGDWVVQYDGDTDTFFFTSSASFSVDAADVTYTSTGSQWTATDVQTALHDLEREVDELQTSLGTAVLETSGNQATFTLTGFTVNPSGTVYWIKTGKKVFIYVRAAITGTSNSAVFASSSTLPVSIRPTNEKIVPMGQMTDSGALVPAAVQVKTDGSLVFLRTYLSGGTTVLTDPVWTTSGVKAWNAGCGFVYDTD